jgi:hypothetical protein
MNDKELLELAAKAAGYELDWDVPPKSPPWVITGTGEERGPTHQFSPLKDDGDALRLAVKCGLSVQIGASVFVYDHPDFCDPAYTGVETCESLKTDPFAATRRAIVRAAAEIGKEQP